MISCSATQRSSGSASASSVVGRVAEVRRDEQQPRGRLGVEHGELVLAEHAAGEEARDRARLDGEHRAGRAADDAAERPGAVRRLRGGGIEHAADRAQVGLDPRLAVDRLGHGQRAGGRRQPGVAGDERLGLVRGAHERLERRRVTRGLQRGDALGDLRCEVPVDHAPRMAGAVAQPQTRGTSASSRDRGLRARRDDRRHRLHDLERRAQRLGAGGERDEAAGLAHDQLRRGDVDRARAAQRDHAVEPPAGDLAERHRDRADRAQPVRARRERVGRVAHPARVGGLDPEQLELAADAPLGHGRVERAPFSRAPPPRHATHSSPAPKS